ncbi:hypothetical protein L557_3845, partial [Bordetella pertussis STO1-CNMC-0004]
HRARCTHLQTQPGRIQPIDSSQLARADAPGSLARRRLVGRLAPIKNRLSHLRWCAEKIGKTGILSADNTAAWRGRVPLCDQYQPGL